MDLFRLTLFGFEFRLNGGGFPPPFIVLCFLAIARIRDLLFGYCIPFAFGRQFILSQDFVSGEFFLQGFAQSYQMVTDAYAWHTAWGFTAFHYVPVIFRLLPGFALLPRHYLRAGLRLQV